MYIYNAQNILRGITKLAEAIRFDLVLKSLNPFFKINQFDLAPLLPTY